MNWKQLQWTSTVCPDSVSCCSVVWKFLVSIKNLLFEGATQYKILGGANAVPGEFPYQAQLQYMNHHFCGATIISSVLILTAAHCVINKRKEELSVVVGRLESNPTEDLTGYRRDIRMVFIHENYNRRTHDHDIAILLLSHEFRFSRLVRPLLIRRTTSQNARRGNESVALILQIILSFRVQNCDFWCRNSNGYRLGEAIRRFLIFGADITKSFRTTGIAGIVSKGLCSLWTKHYRKYDLCWGGR